MTKLKTELKTKLKTRLKTDLKTKLNVFSLSALSVCALALSACGQKHESVQPHKKIEKGNLSPTGGAPKPVFRSDVLSLNEKTAANTTVSEIRFSGEAARQVMDRLAVKEVKHDKISKKIGSHLNCVAAEGFQECSAKIASFYTGELEQTKQVEKVKLSKEMKDKRAKSYTAEFSSSELMAVSNLLTLRFEGKDAFALMKGLDVQSVKPASNSKGLVSYSIGQFDCSMKNGASTQILVFDEALNYACTVVFNLDDGGSLRMKRMAAGQSETPVPKRIKGQRKAKAVNAPKASGPAAAPTQRGLKTRAPVDPQPKHPSRGMKAPPESLPLGD